MITIRREEARDFDPVREICQSAFDGGPEAGLVDVSRATCPDHLSLVAEESMPRNP